MSTVKIIPLGGVREFGLNSLVIETSSGSIIVDTGIMFPKYNPTGIDQIIPDFTYVVENQEAFQGIILTHGHEDHIGALPYLLKAAPIPVYSHPFTLEMVKRKLREYDMDGHIRLIPVHAGQTISLAGMDIEFIEVRHSTMGCYCLNIMTPQGRIIHSGDFQVAPPEFRRIDTPVQLFICESTNAEVDPRCADESRVMESIDAIIKQTEGAVLVSTFSSHVKRIQLLYELAVQNSRKVTIIGRSINQVVDIASDLGILDLDPRDLIKPEEITTVDRSRLMIICTGTQGEMYSVLSLIARGWHKFKARTGDSVVISARIIPGNEIAIARCIDQLIDFGARVFYPDTADVHASGHATHSEILEAVKLLNPRIIMPIHGELRHMKALGDMVKPALNMDPEIVLARPGQVWSLTHSGMELTGEAPHGKCFVDGELTGNIHDVVLRDRRHISEGGLVVVFIVLDSARSEVALGPDIMCKGVVPANMELEIMDEIRNNALQVLDMCSVKETDTQVVQNRMRESLGTMLKSRLGKKPMIIPIIMEM
ncbi:MAG TPA: ribonuclease J [Deltaproteobacteria bacterium]|nr:ribonuclease J [Deltaproteobacteria bacterium]HPR53849.1 ribonuclease J [Deltaproteobacteria bacterium]HXK45951.1 ribonuclease J [Deltaproteobacteria bacterium]